MHLRPQIFQVHFALIISGARQARKESEHGYERSGFAGHIDRNRR